MCVLIRDVVKNPNIVHHVSLVAVEHLLVKHANSGKACISNEYWLFHIIMWRLLSISRHVGIDNERHQFFKLRVDMISLPNFIHLLSCM